MKPRVLIVDDEPRMGDIAGMVLKRDGWDVHGVRSGDAALVSLTERAVDVVLTDLRMPGMDGLALLARIREEHPDVRVVLMTAFATVSTAVQALRDGAFDYLQKPFDNAALVATARRAFDHGRLHRENRVLRAALELRDGPDAPGVVAESEGMRAVLDVVRRVARSRSTVLITGESGTGKEVVAKALHAHSDRVGAPFVAVNAKALADGVLESELFGHERGAFTGATASRQGLFERADGGTLFLDEIGEISAEFQGKLLRVLQEREVQRVGGTKTRAVDVRLVTATNRDLEAEVAAGRFREDLYFRLAVIPVHVPPLRERPEDVLALARHFLARQCSVEGRRLEGFSDEVLAHFARHDWPGNVRELENAIERGVVLARGDRIQAEDLLLRDRPRPAPTGAPRTLQEALDAASISAVQRALQDAQGVRSEAARALGIDRTTLYRIMRRHGLDG